MSMTINLSASMLLKVLKSKWDSPSKRLSQGCEEEEVCYLTKPISYGEFFYKYIICNKPCVLGNWATKNWRSRHEWTTDEDHGCCKPDFQSLHTEFAGSKVPVADCGQRYFNSQCKSEMKLEEFLSYWGKYMAEDYPKGDPCLYLKDWHFVKDFENYQAYTVPTFFQSDWLNEFSEKTSKDDFRFVYMGPKGSWTPFHADVYRSFSWSANICGRKKWILFPPGEENLIKKERNELPYDITTTDTERRNCHIIIQERGEVVFVPSGWFHQVHNLEDTISINHNWLNGGNLSLVVTFLLDQLRLVQNEISDCKFSMSEEEWAQQCQAIMKADSGMNINELVTLLRTIADSRIKKSIPTKSSIFSGSSSTSTEHNNELCILMRKRLCQIQPVEIESEQFCAREDNTSDNVCLNHTIFDLCMILDALERLVHKSDLCLKKSTLEEAEIALSMVHKSLQCFVDALEGN